MKSFLERITNKIVWIAPFTAFLFAFLVGLFPIHNSDVWWHIAWGRKMIALHRIFPNAENFYFTPTSNIYSRELLNTFLGDISLALLYQVGGVTALQLLVVLFLLIGGAAVILVPIQINTVNNKNKFSFIQLFLFIAFALGTCQLQIVRNSLFSLAFFPAVFAIYTWYCHHKGWKPVIFSIILLLVWSFIHPSFILGVIALIILYTGLFLDQWRKVSLPFSLKLLALIFHSYRRETLCEADDCKEGDRFRRWLSVSYCERSSSNLTPQLSASLKSQQIGYELSRLVQILIALFLFLSVSLTYSWQVRQLLVGSATHIFSATEKVFLEETRHYFSIPQEKQQINQSPSLNFLKPTWGNSSLPLSGDFIPTWKILRHPAAATSILLCLCSFLFLLFYRGPNKFGMILLLGFMSYFGVCYFRGTGYATITAIFIITSIIPTFFEKKRLLFLKNFASSLAAFLSIIVLFTLLNLILLKRSELFFMERGRVFGFGKIAAFEDTSYQFVQSHFSKAPCFTTLATGSYASFFWSDKKRVFIDSFFAPHSRSLWNDYDKALKTGDIALLDQYEIQIAIIENSRADWQNAFLSAQDWQPIAISMGTTVFAKRNSLPKDTPVEILFSLAEVERSLSPITQRSVAAAFYNSILSLQLHHQGNIAIHLLKEHEFLFKALAAYLEPSQRKNICQEPKGIKPTMLHP